MKLTAKQRSRYARHLSLDAIGDEGQLRLLTGRVLLVGAGGLGSPCALYLAAAGIGTLSIMDGDTVDVSNLQRQVLYTTSDVGKLKAVIAASRLKALNPDVDVIAHATRLTPENARGLIADHDFVIDATDNFDSKFLIADICHRVGVAYSHAGISAFFGQTFTVLPGKTACYRCIFNAPPPPSDDEPRGPLGVIPGVIGTLQANEAIKFLTGAGTLLTNRLFTFDALTADTRTLSVNPNPDCPLCGINGTEQGDPLSINIDRNESEKRGER
jgi:molybdopterin/thiamine biosynthesis adenylyltransferase